SSAVSVSSAAVELARKIFDDLAGKTVLLIGAGEMCELAAQHLVSGGVRQVIVSNRTAERAAALAGKFGGTSVPFDDLPRGLNAADIVISATDAHRYIIEVSLVARATKERRQRPIFFIDIADPRNIDPKVNDLENVYLFNIDHLQKVAAENLKGRAEEARKADAIVEGETEKFVAWYRSLDYTPTIVALRNKFEEIRRKELEKAIARLPGLSDRERNSLEGLTTGIVNKILHGPLSQLKKVKENGLADSYLDAIQALFQLQCSTPAETKEGDASASLPIENPK
ncbi:MAG TPA: glutamyl-tRNA reductase, partial [Thermodesulfobacteriota bacterium]|nr:glutamyl-tRNA reductase [Thermodesulfobacteriota bacterium]